MIASLKKKCAKSKTIFSLEIMEQVGLMLLLLLYVGSRRPMPRIYCSLQPNCKPLVFRRSNPHRQVSLKSQRRQRSQWREAELSGEKWPRNLAESSDFQAFFRVPLHAANLRHGIDGLTSPPKEGVLRIFFALKNPTSSAGFEPANFGKKASTLPLDHRSGF
jgi:hypothetical protein